MISVAPLTSRLKGRLFGQRPIFTLADERVELAPAALRDVRPAIHLPDEPHRVVQASDGMPVAEYLARLAGGRVQQPPTAGYRFDRAIVADGCVYANGGWATLRGSSRTPVLAGRAQELTDCMLATDQVCEQYFGHWLTDGLSMELLADATGLSPVAMARPTWHQEVGYRDRAGLPDCRLTQAKIHNFWMVDDRSINDDRAKRMAALRARLRGKDAGSNGAPVFLRRVAGADRRLANQEPIAEALHARGFRVLTPETTPVAELTETLRDAGVVVSVEGSALCHGVVNMADGGTIVAIQPPNRANWIQKVWCDAAGLRMAYTVADPLPDGSFAIELDRLLRLFELVDRSAP